MPDQPPQQAPPVQRLRIRYAKRGRLRFTSHRDFSRAFERAVFRARVPMAYSSGFNRIAEELGAALPDGLDLLDVVESPGGSLADLLQASQWQVDLAAPLAESTAAVEAFLATESVPVQRMTKKGMREFDCRAAVVSLCSYLASAVVAYWFFRRETGIPARRALLPSGEEFSAYRDVVRLTIDYARSAPAQLRRRR